MLQISVIVTTYNWPEALRAVLLGLNQQTEAGFEVIVADDGSKEDTKNLINELRTSLKYPLIHSWQEDIGFRLSRSRNLAAAKASGDYIVLIDGDCVPRDSFIQRHRFFAEKGCFASGNRISLPKPLTEEILANQLPIQSWSFKKWLLLRLSGVAIRLTPFIYLRSQWWRKYRNGSYRGATSFSLAIWKSDYERINGFDEAYEGWGREDTDFVIRLMRAGVCRKEVRFAIPVFHLWHAEAPRDQLSNNDLRLQQLKESDQIVAQKGLREHSQ